MVLKIPPPPRIANIDPEFNRWLLELTRILSSTGGVDVGTIPGYDGLVNQVAQNTTDIGDLAGTVGQQANDITAINNNIVAINTNLTTLGARAQVLNGVGDPAPGLGNVNDWYANIGGAAGHRIFVKTGIATWTAFPF